MFGIKDDTIYFNAINMQCIYEHAKNHLKIIYKTVNNLLTCFSGL